MAIAMVKENVRLPVIGKIRLGIRKETDRGTEYPESVPHFVLHDAPEVEKVIGPKATEFDCFFLTDDIDEAIPNWYKWYSGGKRDKAGNIVGGDLKCYGTGPTAISETGEYTAGTAYHIEKRDPVTRIIPTRACMGDKCPDYMGANGRAQCGVAMTVNVFVPEASLFGIFTIDTKSITSIGRFVSQVTLIKEQYGKLKGIPFKIFREPISMKDPKTGAKKTQYILSIKPNEEFFMLKGEAIRAKIAGVMNQNFLGPAAADMIEAPMEDNYPLVQDEYTPKANALATAQTIAEDPEIVDMFAKLAELEGTQKANTPQQRLLNVRGFEAKNKDKPLKEGMRAALNLRIGQAATKHLKKADVVVSAETKVAAVKSVDTGLGNEVDLGKLAPLFEELMALKGTPEKNTPKAQNDFCALFKGDLEAMEKDLLAKIQTARDAQASTAPTDVESSSPAPDANGLI